MRDKSLRTYTSNMEKKNSKSKSGIVLLVGLTCLLVTGCKQVEPEDENKELIQGLLEHELTTPNEKTTGTMKALDAWIEEQNEGGPFSNEYYTYLEDTYKPYFTDSGYDRFTKEAQSLMFHLAADEFNYTTTVTSVDIQQNEEMPTIYNFTTQIVYQKENQDKINGEVRGTAVVHKDGIEKITYFGDEKILGILIYDK